MSKALVFGAGIAGLAAARTLKEAGWQVDLIEATEELGGLAATMTDQRGFRYDRGPHYFLSTLARKMGSELCQPVLGYDEAIHYQGKTYRFPFGLAVIPRFSLSVGWAVLQRSFKSPPDYRNLAALLSDGYGKTFAEEILAPLIQKWAGVTVDQISADFGRRLLPASLSFIIYAALRSLRKHTEDFYEGGRWVVYPRGGMDALFKEFVANHELQVSFGKKLERLDVTGGQIASAFVSGQEMQADAYLSTVPIDSLRMLTDDTQLRDHLAPYRFRGVKILVIKVASAPKLPHRWIWFPERSCPFYRLSEPPPLIQNESDKTALVFEFGTNRGDAIDTADASQLLSLVLETIRAEGIVEVADLNERENIVDVTCEQFTHGYPLLLRSYEERQRQLSAETPLANLFLAGRAGSFRYALLEEAYDSGVSAARSLLQSSSTSRRPSR